MVIVIGIGIFTICILLLYIWKVLRQINASLQSAKKQLEDYLKVVWEGATEDVNADYRVEDEEKKMLWSQEEKEQLFYEVMQELLS